MFGAVENVSLTYREHFSDTHNIVGDIGDCARQKMVL
jgi:hypothetical protein